MATGRSNQLIKQLGEYLVACELARRGLLVATFSGNVPDFDLVATDSKGNSIPIQVKTISGGTWQFTIDKFTEVSFKGDKQILGASVTPQIPHLLCVLVLATEYGKDRFFVLEWEELRDTAINRYRIWLDAKGGIRPKNPNSLHCSVSPNDLKKIEDKWNRIIERLQQP